VKGKKELLPGFIVMFIVRGFTVIEESGILLGKAFEP